MEHRSPFQEAKLVDAFPSMLDYYFETVFEGARKTGTGHGKMGKSRLMKLPAPSIDFETV
jgi:hypothetical protein